MTHDKDAVNLDARWLDILKATGWQTAAIAAACFIFVWLVRTDVLPVPYVWVTTVVGFCGVLCACLAVASFLQAAYNFFPLHIWVLHWRDQRRTRRGLAEYIPTMTEKEREIISYLLAKNHKTFTASKDGGYAATLLSRNIVVILVRPGQIVDPEQVPMTVPDLVWEVLQAHRDQFPYTPPKPGEIEREPWRVHWMSR